MNSIPIASCLWLKAMQQQYLELTFNPKISFQIRTLWGGVCDCWGQLEAADGQYIMTLAVPLTRARQVKAHAWIEAYICITKACGPTWALDPALQLITALPPI